MCAGELPVWRVSYQRREGPWPWWNRCGVVEEVRGLAIESDVVILVGPTGLIGVVPVRAE